MDFKNSETMKNLTRAFAGECQDGAKYQYLADLATQQQLNDVATILKAHATNEMAHGKVFFDYIKEKAPGGIENVEIKATYPMQYKDFEEMFKVTAENEQRQADVVYPEFAKVAKKEGFTDIATKIEQIAKIEACHADALNQLYQMIKNKTIYSKEKQTLWKCMNCGHEEQNKKAWNKCPICNMNQGYVKINLCGCSEDCNC